jgi:hypothetical protein
MSSALSRAIAGLSSDGSGARLAAAKEIYGNGCAQAEQATRLWWGNAELSRLTGPKRVVTVGLAVTRDTFVRIRKANGEPRLAQVPAEQDAEEFELHFADGVALDVLTTREPGGTGAIARYLAKFGEGVQQVEYRCADVDRATAILKQEFGVAPVYPETRPGADRTRVNFFLVAADGRKVLIELYEVRPD